MTSDQAAVGADTIHPVQRVIQNIRIESFQSGSWSVRHETSITRDIPCRCGSNSDSELSVNIELVIFDALFVNQGGPPLS